MTNSKPYYRVNHHWKYTTDNLQTSSENSFILEEWRDGKIQWSKKYPRVITPNTLMKQGIPSDDVDEIMESLEELPIIKYKHRVSYWIESDE